MYFFRYGLGYMKGNERYTVFMGVNITVSNIFFSFFVLDNNCASNCSIGFFLVLDRCLIACYVEMYAELLIEKKKVRVFRSLLFLLILTCPTF